MSSTVSNSKNPNLSSVHSTPANADYVSIAIPTHSNLASTISSVPTPLFPHLSDLDLDLEQELALPPSPNGLMNLPGATMDSPRSNSPAQRRDSMFYDRSGSDADLMQMTRKPIIATIPPSLHSESLIPPPLVAKTSSPTSSETRGSIMAPVNNERRVSHSRKFTLSDAEKNYEDVVENYKKNHEVERYFSCKGEHLNIKKIDSEDFEKTLAKVMQVTHINSETEPLPSQTCLDIRKFQELQESGGYKIGLDICMGLSALSAVPLSWLQNNQDFNLQLGGYIAGGITALGLFVFCKIFGDKLADRSRLASTELRDLIAQQKKEFQAFGQAIIKWWGLANPEIGLSYNYEDPAILEQVGVSEEMQAKRHYLRQVLLTNVFPHLCLYFGVDLNKEYPEKDFTLLEVIRDAWINIEEDSDNENLFNHFENMLSDLGIPKVDREEMLIYPRDALRVVFDEVRVKKPGVPFEFPEFNIMKANRMACRETWQNDVEAELENLRKEESTRGSITDPRLGPSLNSNSGFEGNYQSSSPSAASSKVSQKQDARATDSLRSRIRVASAKQSPRPEHKGDQAEETAPPAVNSLSLPQTNTFNRQSMTASSLKTKLVSSIDASKFGATVGMMVRRPDTSGKARLSSQKPEPSPFNPGFFDTPSPSHVIDQAPRTSTLSLSSSIPSGNTAPSSSKSAVAGLTVEIGSSRPSSSARPTIAKGKATPPDKSGNYWSFSPAQSPTVNPALTALTPTINTNSTGQLVANLTPPKENEKESEPLKGHQMEHRGSHHHHLPNARLSLPPLPPMQHIKASNDPALTALARPVLGRRRSSFTLSKEQASVLAATSNDQSQGS